MRAAAYVRVSTAEQSPGLQRDEIAAEAAKRGYTVGAWFEEKASAKTTTRAALDALRAEVKSGKWKVLFVWKLDRLCRSGIRDSLMLVDEFRAAGCKVISLRDPFDFDGPFADMFVSFVSWFAKHERDVLVTRVKAGMAAARRRGKRIGRPRRVVDLPRARRLIGEGRSMRHVAKVLHLSAATLCRALKAPSAAGEASSTLGPTPAVAEAPSGAKAASPEEVLGSDRPLAAAGKD